MGATFRTLHCDRQLPQRRAGLPPRRDRLDGTGHVQQRIDQLRAQREWTNLYTSINYCNQCLDNIPNVPDNDDEGIKQTKATSIAEARFLRAFYYYRLFINFGERLPMFEHELEGTEEEFYPPQVEAGRLKTFIETELSECQANLPENGIQTWPDASLNILPQHS